jgi:hypothetical protein
MASIDFTTLGISSFVRSMNTAASHGIDQNSAIGDMMGTVTDFIKLNKAAAIAIGAITALAAAAHSAAHSLLEVGNIQNRTAGTTTQALFLQQMGSALGIDIAGAARAIRAAGNSGGLGTAAAVRAGLPVGQVDLGSAVNEAAGLIKVVDFARSLSSREEQLAFLRNLQVEQLAPLLDLTASQIDMMRREAEVRSSLFSRQHMADAAMFNFELDRLKNAFLDITAIIGVHVMPTVRDLAAIMQAIANIDRGQFGQNLGTALEILFNPISFIRTHFLEQEAAKDKANSAMNRNTNAIEQNTQELRSTRGIYGGGPRAAGAIPTPFQGRGDQVEQALKGSAARWGAYSAAM